MNAAILGVALGLMVLANPARAASTGATATATGLASATVVAPITLVPRADLDFGVLSSSPMAGGTATVAPYGSTISVSGSTRVQCDSSACAAPHAAHFDVIGEAGRSYLVALPRDLSISPANGSGGPLRVTGFVLLTEHTLASDGTGRLDASGQDGFEVGATLIVPAGTPAGHYRTSLPVIVSYG